MELIRHIDLPQATRRQHDGPCAGGTFWAAKTAHDLPDGPMAHAHVHELLRGGRLWLQDATRPGTWQEITNPADLPKFQRGFGEADRMLAVTFAPFLPEFFFVPNGGRGRCLVARAERRAWARN